MRFHFTYLIGQLAYLMFQAFDASFCGLLELSDEAIIDFTMSSKEELEVTRAG